MSKRGQNLLDEIMAEGSGHWERTEELKHETLSLTVL